MSRALAPQSVKRGSLRTMYLPYEDRSGCDGLLRKVEQRCFLGFVEDILKEEQCSGCSKKPEKGRRKLRHDKHKENGMENSTHVCDKGQRHLILDHKKREQVQNDKDSCTVGSGHRPGVLQRRCGAKELFEEVDFQSNMKS